MKNITVAILATLIAQTACVSNEPKKTYFNNYSSMFYDGTNSTRVNARLERAKNSDVTIHIEKELDKKWWFPVSKSCSIVTIAPNNRVDLEVQIKAKTPQAQEIINTIVTNQAEMVRCVKTTPGTREDVDRCVDLYYQTWLKTRPSDVPTGSISPEQYQEFVTKRWQEFAALVNNFDIVAQKENDHTTSLKMSGEINTKTVEVLAYSPCALLNEAAMQARCRLAETRNLLAQHAYINAIGVMHAMCAKKDFDTSHASVRVTKLEVTNLQPVKALTYEKPTMQ